MRKRSRKPAKDFNEVAFNVVRRATDPPETSPPTQDEISRIMSAMGRKGGLKGGKRRLEMPPERRRELAFKAAKARWAKSKKRKR